VIYQYWLKKSYYSTWRTSDACNASLF